MLWIKYGRPFACTRRPGTLKKIKWVEGCCTQSNGAVSYYYHYSLLSIEWVPNAKTFTAVLLHLSNSSPVSLEVPQQTLPAYRTARKNRSQLFSSPKVQDQHEIYSALKVCGI